MAALDEPTLQSQLGDAMRRGYVAAYRILGDREESRDACQEAAARALGAAERFDTSRPLYPWFYRILKNLCLERLRRRRPTQDALPPSLQNAEGTLILQERHAAVQAAIEKLDPPLREVIELRHFQDLSYEEIAAVLDCPVGTVMSRLFRARKALRGALSRSGLVDGPKDGRGGSDG